MLKRDFSLQILANILLPEEFKKHLELEKIIAGLRTELLQIIAYDIDNKIMRAKPNDIS